MKKLHSLWESEPRTASEVQKVILTAAHWFDGADFSAIRKRFASVHRNVMFPDDTSISSKLNNDSNSGGRGDDDDVNTYDYLAAHLHALYLCFPQVYFSQFHKQIEDSFEKTDVNLDLFRLPTTSNADEGMLLCASLVEYSTSLQSRCPSSSRLLTLRLPQCTVKSLISKFGALINAQLLHPETDALTTLLELAISSPVTNEHGKLLCNYFALLRPPQQAEFLLKVLDWCSQTLCAPLNLDSPLSQRINSRLVKLHNFCTLFFNDIIPSCCSSFDAGCDAQKTKNRSVAARFMASVMNRFLSTQVRKSAVKSAFESATRVTFVELLASAAPLWIRGGGSEVLRRDDESTVAIDRAFDLVWSFLWSSSGAVTGIEQSLYAALNDQTQTQRTAEFAEVSFAADVVEERLRELLGGMLLFLQIHRSSEEKVKRISELRRNLLVWRSHGASLEFLHASTKMFTEVPNNNHSRIIALCERWWPAKWLADGSAIRIAESESSLSSQKFLWIPRPLHAAFSKNLSTYFKPPNHIKCLQWLPTLTYVSLKYNQKPTNDCCFPLGPIVVDAIQFAVMHLLLSDDSPAAINRSEAVSKLTDAGCSKESVVKTIDSLLKCKVLLVSTGSTDEMLSLAPDPSVSGSLCCVANDFIVSSDPLHVVGLARSSATTADNHNLAADLARTEAAIVRLLKAERCLEGNEISQRLQQSVNSSVIRRALGSLERREYIRADDSAWVYIA